MVLSIHFLITFHVLHSEIKNIKNIKPKCYFLLYFKSKVATMKKKLFHDLLTSYVIVCVHSCSNAAFDGNPDHAEPSSSSFKALIGLNRQANFFHVTHELSNFVS